MLRLHEVVKHYPSPGGETVKAIDGISAVIQAGEFVALYGPSGSGKSTLLNLVAGLLQPDAGRISLDGKEVTELRPSELAEYQRVDIGFVQQSPDLLPGVTAVDNAVLKLLATHVRWREAARRVTPLLIRLGLEKRLKHRPDELSMGERQRVLIARALSTDPKLVLADEPTGSLDRQRGSDVFGLLVELCRERGTSMLLATHDPQAAAVADRTYLLEDGHLLERDPHHFAAVDG